MHGVTFNNVIRITFLSSGQLFSLPEIPKLAFDAQNSSKQHIKFSYYFTESTLYPNYKERSNNAEYEKWLFIIPIKTQCVGEIQLFDVRKM